MQFTSLLLAVTVTLLYVVLIPDAGKCGISGLHKWFRARFPSAVREIHKRDVVETDHLLFDLNQLLYQAALASPSTFATSADAEDSRIIRALWRILRSTFKRFRVRKNVVLAIDGVPPLAKLAMSQQRRQRAARAGILSECIEQCLGPKKSQRGSPTTAGFPEGLGGELDILADDVRLTETKLARTSIGASLSKSACRIPAYLLSPGTYFMRLVETECRKLARELLRSGQIDAPKFFLSGPSSFGEGELKLANWINMASSADSWTENKEEPAEAETTYKALPSDSIVIIGGDADLVVQCLALPYTSNLFVYNPQNITHSKNIRVIYSLRALLGELERLFPGNSHLVRNDFALMCILNGNDYLPKLPGFSFARFSAAYEATRRRPEYRDSSWVDAEQRSFNWPFFSAFIEELDRLQNVEMVARQRDSCVRLAGPKTPSGLCKASPLQIVNQLVAQKRLVMSSADGATRAVKKLRWCFQENQDGFVCDIDIVGVMPHVMRSSTVTGPSDSKEAVQPEGSVHAGNLPQSEGSVESICTNRCVASSATDKKTAQQRAAFKLLQIYFPELLPLVDEGPWRETAAVTTSAHTGDFSESGPISAATFQKAASTLRVTTPSNTLNNLCLVALHSPPTFCFVYPAEGSNSCHHENSEGEKGTAEGNMAYEGGLKDKFPIIQASHTFQVDVLVKEQVVFSSKFNGGSNISKARIKHAVSMQALETWAPELYHALRAQNWCKNGSQTAPGGPPAGTRQEHVKLEGKEKDEGSGPTEASTGDPTFSVEAHVASEREKARAYIHGLLWNLQTYVDGICPDNLWYFTYTSAPSLLAIRDVVQQQLRTTDGDPFSRLPPESFGTAKEASNTKYIARSDTPQPVPQWLYSAALLPKSALEALYAREKQTEGLPEAPFAKQLLKARAFLEALLDKKKAAPSLESWQLPQQANLQWLLRGTPAVLQSPTTALGGESIFSQGSRGDTTVSQDDLITADTILLALHVLNKKHQQMEGRHAAENADIASFLGPHVGSFWTVLRREPSKEIACPPQKTVRIPVWLTRESTAQIFSPSGRDRPWSKESTDKGLCTFSLRISTKQDDRTRRLNMPKERSATSLDAGHMPFRPATGQHTLPTAKRPPCRPPAGTGGHVGLQIEGQVGARRALNLFTGSYPVSSLLAGGGAHRGWGQMSSLKSTCYNICGEGSSQGVLEASWRALQTANFFLNRRLLGRTIAPGKHPALQCRCCYRGC